MKLCNNMTSNHCKGKSFLRGLLSGNSSKSTLSTEDPSERGVGLGQHIELGRSRRSYIVKQRSSTLEHVHTHIDNPMSACSYFKLRIRRKARMTIRGLWGRL